MDLELELTLAHATMRGEKAGGEDGAVASDLKLTGAVLADALVGLFSSASAFTRSLGNYYGKNDEPITADVRAIELSTDLEDVEAVFLAPISREERLRFRDAKLNNILLHPQPGRAVEFTARLQFYPTDEQWAALPHLLRKSHAVTLTGGRKAVPKDDQQGALELQQDRQAG